MFLVGISILLSFSVDDLIVLTEAVAYEMMQGNYDRALHGNVSTMYSNLKLYGAQLEALYKDFLDRLVCVVLIVVCKIW